ncbi:MAG: hypothetical protein KDD75_05330, partial [Caldilineaceae bacterium]|nr:hypothetical protein [Caldilineaceae bacterium]
MTLSHKERLRRAIRHEPVDRLPTQINYTGKMAAKLAEAYGITTGELPARLDNHLLRVDLTFRPRVSEDGVAGFDWWGAGFDTREEGYFVCVSPLQESP